MNNKLLRRRIAAGALLLWAAWIPAQHALAVEYYLRADTVQVTMPDSGEVITMWGFALDSAFGAGDGVVSVPGPQLTVPVGDPNLTIHLENKLPAPVSIVIPGQRAAMTPVLNGGRVRSFTHETPSLNSSAVDYTWNTMQPGTYLYHSGTHPAVQVQMGLYGSVIQDQAAGQIYPGINYDSAVTLLFSEIDPALHTAVANGSYGTAAYPSTIDYAPKYFLINGKPYAQGAPPLSAGQMGQRILLRFLNAGLTTHVPVLDGLYMRLVAEDGKPYPYTKEQYSVFLPAAKTVDALITPTSANNQAALFPLYDRMLDLANPPAIPTSAATAGGMLTYLAVAGNTESPPTITSSAVTAGTQGELYNYTVTATDPDGGPLTFSLDVAPTGMSIDAGNGLINWTPSATQVGANSVTVRVQDASGLFATQSYTVTVANVNDAPTAANDAYSGYAGVALSVAAPGVLGNDSDSDGDGDALTASVVDVPLNGTLALNTDGSFSYTPNAGFSGGDSFTYQAHDGTLPSTSATVTLTVLPNQPPVAVNDTVSTQTNTPKVIAVLANDRDPGGSLDVGTVTITSVPNKGGTAQINADGTVTYQSRLNFLGTELFRYTVKDNFGATSNIATVKVNVLKGSTLQFSAAAYSASEAGASATITVARSGNATAAASVDYTTTNGTAITPGDYTAASGTLNWAAGDTTAKTFTIPIINDSAVEPAETVNLSLSNVSGASLGTQSSAVLTITNDDTTLQFSAATYSVNEAGGSATITVTRVGNAAAAVAVNYATANGTAVAPGDYTSASGTLNWAAGDAGAKTFSVAIINDALVESSETVQLTLSNPSGGATLGTPGNSTLSIINNDTSLQFSSATYWVSEGTANAVIKVTRKGFLGSAVTINYATTNGTAVAPGDYTAKSGTLTFAAGVASQTFSIPIVNDTLKEPGETVKLGLNTPGGGATLGTPNLATLTIGNND